MSRDNHGAGPCVHCEGAGTVFDARIGDVECHECDGAGRFDASGEPTRMPLSEKHIISTAEYFFVTGENQRFSEGLRYRSLGVPANVKEADLIEFARAIEAAHGISAPPVADPGQAGTQGVTK